MELTTAVTAVTVALVAMTGLMALTNSRNAALVSGLGAAAMLAIASLQALGVDGMLAGLGVVVYGLAGVVAFAGRDDTPGRQFAQILAWPAFLVRRGAGHDQA